MGPRLLMNLSEALLREWDARHPDRAEDRLKRKNFLFVDEILDSRVFESNIPLQIAVGFAPVGIYL